MNFNEIIKFLSEETGIDPDSIGVKTIENAIVLQIKSSGISNPDEYLQLIKTNHTELEKIIAEITVPETWFFRDKEPYEYLKKIVNNDRQGNKFYKKLRILSAPCSNGEEPYSIAMTLIESGLSSDNFIIDAVDINQKAIDNAQRGAYTKASFRSNVTNYQAKYFKEYDCIFNINDEIKNCVHFGKKNLIKKDFLIDNPNYDIIFCKNLLIYLGLEARKIVLSNIERLLEPNGTLFVGHSEIIFLQQFGYKFMGHKHSFACRKSSDINTNVFPINQERYATQSRKILNNKSKISQFNNNIKNNTKNYITNDDNPPDILEYVKKLANNGNFDDVEIILNKYFHQINSDPRTYYFKGLISEAKNNTESAEEYYNKALYLDPNNFESLLQLSLIYEKKGEDSRAKIMKERLKRLPINEDMIL